MTDTTDAGSGARLELNVSCEPFADAPGAATLEALAPLEARLTMADGERVGVSLRWPGADDQGGSDVPARAEVRWLVDRVRRQLAKAFTLRTALLRCDDGSVDADTLTALGLDLHQAFQGRAQVPESVATEVARVAAAEDRFRGWVNEDPAERTSIAIARDVSAWGAQRDDVSVEVLDEARLAELGLRLLLAVGSASSISPPRLVIARYVPAGADPSQAWMLLGKGVTFDTGGINVKPYESFVSMMKNDMGGAALAWTLFSSLVEAGYGRPLTLVLPTCENPVGENAMRPGSIVKSYRGHRVRIDHTDAEGRLILADGLAYASWQYPPERVFSFATLTTAALRSYGPYATPVHFAPPHIETALRRAADVTGHDLHFFERRAWHVQANRDEEADLKNTARLPSHASMGAGSRNAAHFLLNFTDAPLTHFDIFASTWNWAGDAPGAGYGATGAPCRTVLRALEALAL